MHPILERRRLLALYLGTWIVGGGLLGSLLIGRGALAWPEALLIALPLALVYAFVCLSAWYVSRSMPLATTSPYRIVISALAAAIVSSAGWLVASRLWINVLISRGLVAGNARELAAGSSIVWAGVLLYLLSHAVSYLLATFEETRETERRALQVQVLAREAELRSLRAQIDPHFLFNSLHSISALTTADPGAARRMCLLLAEFLRESLALGGEDRITLARELKLAERFLDVERIRFGNRLQVEISGAANGLDGCIVPPLLLQPIVENAVTHGVAHVIEGGTIRVTASRTGETVSIVVQNPCDPDRPKGKGAGVGLANVRARITAVHGVDAHLHASERDGTFRVELVFPVERLRLEPERGAGGKPGEGAP